MSNPTLFCPNLGQSQDLGQDQGQDQDQSQHLGQDHSQHLGQAPARFRNPDLI